VGLTVSATGTEGGAYCECNRDRSTADRLLVTIAIAAIDIQQYTSTVLYTLFVYAVQLMGAVYREEIQCVCKLYLK
jgi:hypothetical protein